VVKPSLRLPLIGVRPPYTFETIDGRSRDEYLLSFLDRNAVYVRTIRRANREAKGKHIVTSCFTLGLT